MWLTDFIHVDQIVFIVLQIRDRKRRCLWPYLDQPVFSDITSSDVRYAFRGDVFSTSLIKAISDAVDQYTVI